MNFGPAEMAQMMDGAKALLTFTMISSISIGLVLGVIVAFFVAFFPEKLDRDRAEPQLTNGQLPTPNPSAEPNIVNAGAPLVMVPDNRVTPFSAADGASSDGGADARVANKQASVLTASVSNISVAMSGTLFR